MAVKPQTFNSIRDQYTATRGGRPHFLNLYCDHCGQHIALYQKDNPGKLKRLYLDRIAAPSELADINNQPFETIPNMVCVGCQRLIAVPGIYDKEPRKVYLLLSYAVVARVTSGSFPPAVTRISLDKKRLKM